MGKRVCRVRRRGFRSGEVGVWRGFGDGEEGGEGKEAKREVRWGRGLGRGVGGGGGILRGLGVGCFWQGWWLWRGGGKRGLFGVAVVVQE